MANYIDYVNESLGSMKETKSLYLFKQKTIEQMTKRANELVSKGIKDENVISQIIIEEYPDLVERYGREVGAKHAKNKKIKATKTVVLGSLTYALLLVFAYLALSFKTLMWGKTWILLVGGFVLPVAIAMLAGVFKSKKESTLSSAASRVMLAGSIMLIATVLFLCLLLFTSVSNSWLVFLGAVVAVLVADAAFAAITKQKLSLVTYLLYIPAIAVLVYVILGLSGLLAWHPGWMVIVAAAIVDIVIIMLKVGKGKTDSEEEEWSKN
ncbi:MAG: hypothetical protein IJ262_07015 [Clostridia bacterium]|nr:hypothetical protein [Clostridia bacterium]